MTQEMTKAQATEFLAGAREHFDAGTFGDYMGYSEKDYAQIENKAFQLYSQGRYDKALILLDGLVAMNSNRRYPFLLRGEVLLKSGDRAQALECFMAAHEIAPEDITVISKLGEANLGLGRADVATGHFATVLADANSPDDHAAKRRARVLLKVAEKFEERAA